MPKKGKKEGIDIKEFIDTTRKDITKAIKEKYDKKEAEKILGGKQFRGVLTVLSWRATGGKDEDYKKVLDTAAAVEGMHGSSLILDDIFDGDKMRRGKESLWVAEGIGNAVLTAHHVITSALDTILNRGTDVLHSVISGWSKAVEGEKKDLGIMKKIGEEIITKPSIPEEAYFDVISKKTASFFATAAKGGAQVAGADEDTVKTMEEYGEACGIAYQLSDDLVDIGKGKLEGAMILPIIIASSGEKVVRDKLLSFALGGTLKPSEILSDMDINIKGFFVPEIKKYVKKAQEIAETIPDSDYKKLLQEYPVYITKEMLKEGGIRIKI